MAFDYYQSVAHTVTYILNSQPENLWMDFIMMHAHVKCLHVLGLRVTCACGHAERSILVL